MRSDSCIPHPATQSAVAHDPKLTLLAWSCVPKQGCHELLAETHLSRESAASRRRNRGPCSFFCLARRPMRTCQQDSCLKPSRQLTLDSLQMAIFPPCCSTNPIPTFHLPSSLSGPKAAFLCPCQRTGRGCPIVELRRLTPWGRICQRSGAQIATQIPNADLSSQSIMASTGTSLAKKAERYLPL